MYSARIRKMLIKYDKDYKIISFEYDPIKAQEKKVTFSDWINNKWWAKDRGIVRTTTAAWSTMSTADYWAMERRAFAARNIEEHAEITAITRIRPAIANAVSGVRQRGGTQAQAEAAAVAAVMPIVQEEAVTVATKIAAHVNTASKALGKVGVVLSVARLASVIGDEVWNRGNGSKTMKEVKDQMFSFGGAAAGAQAGAIIGTVGGPLGIAIGELSGALLGGVLGGSFAANPVKTAADVFWAAGYTPSPDGMDGWLHQKMSTPAGVNQMSNLLKAENSTFSGFINFITESPYQH